MGVTASGGAGPIPAGARGLAGTAGADVAAAGAAAIPPMLKVALLALLVAARMASANASLERRPPPSIRRKVFCPLSNTASTSTSLLAVELF